ncbi:MAG: hypothetical protein A3F10_03020 [Coxiella sp. RIFCSPHIGHO2_12_FULL_42_15]|nr:MAG: hypothetical protein A3F10_03020 [Coxiella sp. RIFCSPHIGHO2_12_FULL_42_15]
MKYTNQENEQNQLKIAAILDEPITVGSMNRLCNMISDPKNQSCYDPRMLKHFVFFKDKVLFFLVEHKIFSFSEKEPISNEFIKFVFPSEILFKSQLTMKNLYSHFKEIDKTEISRQKSIAETRLTNGKILEEHFNIYLSLLREAYAQLEIVKKEMPVDYNRIHEAKIKYLKLLSSLLGFQCRNASIRSNFLESIFTHNYFRMGREAEKVDFLSHYVVKQEANDEEDASRYQLLCNEESIGYLEFFFRAEIKRFMKKHAIDQHEENQEEFISDMTTMRKKLKDRRGNCPKKIIEGRHYAVIEFTENLVPDEEGIFNWVNVLGKSGGLPCQDAQLWLFASEVGKSLSVFHEWYNDRLQELDPSIAPVFQLIKLNGENFFQIQVSDLDRETAKKMLAIVVMSHAKLHHPSRYN